MAESQSFPQLFNVSGSQFIYDAFVERAGCSGASDTLACLRGLDSATLQNASVSMPLPGRTHPPNFLYSTTIDGDLIPDLPFNLFNDGRFVDVPTVFGSVFFSAIFFCT
jgi:carboxylesterase type B